MKLKPEYFPVSGNSWHISLGEVSGAEVGEARKLDNIVLWEKRARTRRLELEFHHSPGCRDI